MNRQTRVKRGIGRRIGVLWAVGVMATVCRAGSLVEGAGQQGAFEMPGSQARLAAEPDGSWKFQFALPPGSAAGVWTSGFGTNVADGRAHVLRYEIKDVAVGAEPLLAKWEIKGTRGVQQTPVLISGLYANGQIIVDWGRIGQCREVVLAVSHAGGTTISGALSVHAHFDAWPAWYSTLSSGAGRWVGVLVVALCLGGLARVFPMRQQGSARGANLWKAAGIGVWAAVAWGGMAALLGSQDTVAGQSAYTPLAVAGASAILGWIAGLVVSGKAPSGADLFRHAVVGGLVANAASDMPVWTAAASLAELGRISRVGAVVFWMAYHFGHFRMLAVYGRSLDAKGAARILCVPFLFGLLLSLSNRKLMVAVSLGLGVPAPLMPEWGLIFLGRVLSLAGFNVLAALACLGTWKEIRKRAADAWMLPLAAVGAVAAPWVADAGSGMLAFPTGVRVAVALSATVLSQAGLWAEVYLLTGLLLDAVRGHTGTDRHLLTGYAGLGARKGLWFSGWAMGLIHAGNLALGSECWNGCSRNFPILLWAAAGAVVFPLAKTIIESFDGSPSFSRRLAESWRRPSLMLRGAVVGSLAALGWGHGFESWPLSGRAAWGCGVGVVAYAGVSLLRDALLGFAGKGGLGGARLYLTKAVLGGLAGAALGFYFDAAQTPVIVEKLKHYAGFGFAPAPYEVYPLLSRWGFLSLGDYYGGVRLLWNETLAGVISWGVAAWLFAINRSALMAVFQREITPLRRLFSREGVVELSEGTIFVLRWGLWMAPIIFTFLRQMPVPTWYNQDGAVRTVCCMAQSLLLDRGGFESWSLTVFMWVLAYDCFRVLIWVDHMGLRVATLVNLSFIGMDRLDARVARFLCADATARCFPEGIKRFTTWAPLLLPFYIPAGAAWNQVWAQSQYIKATTPPILNRFWAQPPGLVLLEGAGLAVVVAAAAWWAAARRRRRPAGRTQEVGLRNSVYSVDIGHDGAMVSLCAERGIDFHRRAYDRVAPSGRALFVAERCADASNGWDVWPICGNYPREIGIPAAWARHGTVLVGHHADRAVETEIRMELPDDQQALEAWAVTVRNTSGVARTVMVVPYLEWVLNTPGADRGHTQYNRLFVDVAYRSTLGGVVARHHQTHMTGFLVSEQRPEGMHLSRVEFIGRAGTVWSPEAIREDRWRAAEATGPCPLMDAAAALSLRVTLGPGAAHTFRWWAGCAGPGVAVEDMVGLHAPVRVGDEHQDGRAVPLRHGVPPSGVTLPYASFREGGRVMCVRSPFTPRPYDHTMANGLGHVLAVTHRGLHSSASVNAQQNRLTPDWADTVTREAPGEALYLFDPDSGEWFSPTWEPLRSRGASYETEFGVDGTAVFHMRHGSLSTELTVFVPPDEPLGVYLLKIRNAGAAPRNLNVACYFEMVLAERPEHAGRLTPHPAPDRRGVVVANPRNTFRTGPAFVAMTPAPEAMVTRRGDFFGMGRSVAHPAWVQGEMAIPADDEAPVAALRRCIQVMPQGEVTVVAILGQVGSDREAQNWITRYADVAHAEAKLLETRQWWKRFMGTLEVATSEPGFDGLLHWLKYQTVAERLWARKGFYQASGAFGFRDQLQDAVNLIWVDPELARRQLLLHAGQQFIEGDAAHWFFRTQEGQTGLSCRSHASDNLLWLGWGVVEYVRMTGDVGLLDEPVPYLDSEIPLPPLPGGRHGIVFFPLRSPVRETMCEHVMRAIDLVLRKRIGRHGLPLIGTGDWNDSFDEIGCQGRGESVWLGFFLLYVLEGMLPHLERRRGASRTRRYRDYQNRLRAALEATWRGDRYLRAIHDDGAEIGIRGGGAWEADALTAAWAVLAGADPDRARTAFDTALAILERETVILLGWPPVVETTKPGFGRVCQYPPGVRENGMYSHGVQWLVGAARVLGERCRIAGDSRGAAGYRETAWRLWRKISPLAHCTPDQVEIYGGQPNKQAADYLTETEPGRMIWHGYTGAAGWMLRQACEGVVGALLKDNTLMMPEDLDEPRGDLRVRAVRRHASREA